MRGPLSKHRLLILGLFGAACVVLTVLARLQAPHYSLPATAAIRAARAYPPDRRLLAGRSHLSVRVVPLDGSLQRVTFFEGARVLLDAGVDAHGQVLASERHLPGEVASGAPLANRPWVLCVFALIFMAATLVTPLLCARNLDVLALVSFTVTIVLVNERLLYASVLSSSLTLVYLIVRCMWIAHRDIDRPRVHHRPLLVDLTARMTDERRTRLLGMTLAATIAAVLMIVLSSSGFSDVAMACMTGASDLLRGVLPYGHDTTALHGDTYPLLNYLLYVPGAVLTPVSDTFSDLSGSLVITATAVLSVGWLLPHALSSRSGRGRAERDLRLLVALSWFSFAPVLLSASAGSNDVLAAVPLALMLATRRGHTLSLLALSAAAWVKLVPLALAPIWLCAQPGGRLRRVWPSLLASAAIIVVLLADGGVAGIAEMVRALSFQLTRGSLFAPWRAFHLLWAQPLVQAATLALIAHCAMELRRRQRNGDDRRRVSAFAAAILLAIGLCANYWTWSYLPWVFPFLAIVLFATPPVIEAPQPTERHRPRMRGHGGRQSRLHRDLGALAQLK